MSDTAQLLANSVDTFLLRHAALPEAEFFDALSSGGFALALAAEEDGGLCATWAEAATIALCWGYHAAPFPIVELLLAHQVASAGGEPDIASRLTMAPMPAGGMRPSIAALYPGVDLCLVAGFQDGIARLVSTKGCETALNIADEPCLLIADLSAQVSYEALRLPSGRALLRRGTILTTAQMLGAMERVVEIVAEHARLRNQFGRPLAKFQLVQTLVSDAAAELEVTRTVLEQALALLDQDTEDDLVWYAAKSQAARAATLVAANAHQLMGAIGFTQEHILHRYTRRLWAWRDAWLNQSDADEAIGRFACAKGGEGLWGLIADPLPPGTSALS